MPWPPTTGIIKNWKSLGFSEKTGTDYPGGFLNVKGYGAQGDGVADDTQAFNDAIADLPDNGSLWIPYGTYLISSELVVSGSNKRIFGDGWGSILKANFTDTEAAPKSLLKLTGTYALVENLAFACNRNIRYGLQIAESCSMARSIWAERSLKAGVFVAGNLVEISLEHIRVKGADPSVDTLPTDESPYGILVADGTTDCVLRNCIAQFCDVGIRVEDGSTFISDCHCYRGPDASAVMTSCFELGTTATQSAPYMINRVYADNFATYGIKLINVRMVFMSNSYIATNVTGSTAGIRIEATSEKIRFFGNMMGRAAWATIPQAISAAAGVSDVDAAGNFNIAENVTNTTSDFEWS